MLIPPLPFPLLLPFPLVLPVPFPLTFSVPFSVAFIFVLGVGLDSASERPFSSSGCSVSDVGGMGSSGSSSGSGSGSSSSSSDEDCAAAAAAFSAALCARKGVSGKKKKKSYKNCSTWKAKKM